MTPGMDGKSLHERAKAVNLRKNLNDFTGYLGTNPYFIRMGVFGEIALIREENGLIEKACLDPQVSQDLSAGYLTLSCRGKVRGRRQAARHGNAAGQGCRRFGNSSRRRRVFRLSPPAN